MNNPAASLGATPLRGLAALRQHRSKRVSSYDRTGGNADRIRIPAGDTATLADIGGAGCINHIWFTIACGGDRNHLRNIVLRMFWDGEQEPSVQVPVGDFFGIGHARCANFASLPLTMGPNGGRGFNSWFPMPFGTKAVITAENECDCQVDAFYYYVDYEAYDAPLENMGRFHAWWNRDCPTHATDGKPNISGADNYLLMEAEGHGHYVGCVVNIHGLREGWWGEGDDMIFVDGEPWPPSLHGTGTEDYFCGAWCFREPYQSPYHGLHLLGNDDFSGKWSMYRFHIEDPIVFHQSIRATIEHGHANDRADDWSSTAYWYQSEPHRPFGPILPVEQRLPIDAYTITPRAD